MAIINDNDRYLTYRYRVKTISIDFGNGIYKKLKPEQVKSLVIINDYLNNAFPIIQLKLSINSRLYYRILRNKDKVGFILNIRNYYTVDKKSDKSLFHEWLNEKFSLILDDSDEDLYSNLRTKNNGSNQEDEELYEQANEVEFYLFKRDLIQATQPDFSCIYRYLDITSFLAITLLENGITNVLMSKPDNSEVYNMITIPHMKFIEALKYVDTFYGIYKTGAIIYFGITRSYIIKFDTKCTAYETGEITSTTIIVPQAGSSMTQSCCAVQKAGHTNKNYIIADYETIDFTEPIITDSQINGRSVVIHNTMTGEHETATIAKNYDAGELAKLQSGSSTKIIENHGLNKFLHKEYKKIKMGLSTAVTVEFSDIDVSVLEPNKKFNFVFEDTSLSQKYNGSYILGKSEIGMFRSTEDLNVSVRCTFYSDIGAEI